MTGPDDLVARLRRGLAPPPSTNGRAPAVPTAEIDDLVAAALARADADGLVDVAWVSQDTPVGPLLLAATPSGIVRVAYAGEDDVLEDLATHVSPRVVHLPGRLDGLRRQLDEYFAGRRRHFEVPIDRQLSHGYRRTVLEALSEVPYGHTVSYRDLAERTGNPRATRAVGTAMATNPIAIVVPCHRVIGSNGKLTGYGGGLPLKQRLLDLEGSAMSLFRD